MAENLLRLELIHPERVIFSGEVCQVNAPGSEGDFGVLAGHSSFVSTLRAGFIEILEGKKTRKVLIYGGVAEVSETGMKVLAENAFFADEMDKGALKAEKARLAKEDSPLAKECIALLEGL